MVRKDDFYTIVINEALCQKARIEAYRHELDHIERGDFDSDENTGLCSKCYIVIKCYIMWVLSYYIGNNVLWSDISFPHDFRTEKEKEEA